MVFVVMLIIGQQIEREVWLKVHRRLEDRDNFGEEIYTIWDFYYKGYLISLKTDPMKKKYNEEKKELYIYKNL